LFCLGFKVYGWVKIIVTVNCIIPVVKKPTVLGRPAAVRISPKCGLCSGDAITLDKSLGKRRVKYGPQQEAKAGNQSPYFT
jgi:hypothetical protein